MFMTAAATPLSLAARQWFFQGHFSISEPTAKVKVELD
jgi:hypothetical protein